MDEKLRKKAEKKVEAKMAFYILAVIFSFVSVILLMLSFYLNGNGFWLRLPIPVFAMVLAILYLSAFGLPSTGPINQEWKEEEIEREMIRLYRQKHGRLPSEEELSEEDILELQELERLKKKWDGDGEFV
jgi:hypothetical protein